MKLNNYLIQEAYDAQDWQLACRLVSGDERLEISECEFRIFRDPENIPEIIIDHYDQRLRWSIYLGKVNREVMLMHYVIPRILVYTHHYE